MMISVEQIEERIHLGWEKCPTPRTYIRIKRETYAGLRKRAVFIDEEFGEWEAAADGVMRGGMHPKRRQKDFTKVKVSKAEFRKLYIEQNLSVDEMASHFECHKAKILKKIKEFDLKKPMRVDFPSSTDPAVVSLSILSSMCAPGM